MTTEIKCLWCERAFEQKIDGAHRKQYCSTGCKDQFHSAKRKWAQQELDHGRVTIAALKSL
jgi:hypothetical protein